MTDRRAKEPSFRECRSVAALLACSALVAAGCSKSHTEPGTSDAGAEPNEGDGHGGTGSAGSAGAAAAAASAGESAGGAGASADAGTGPHSRRCELELPPSDPQLCPDGSNDGHVGYYAVQAAEPQMPFTCLLVEQSYCSGSALPFATLTECLAECEAGVDPDATLCQEPGDEAPACEPSAGADRARIEAQTPFGALHLTRAWLDRFQGFGNGVTIHFTSRLEARVDARPSVRVTLHEFGEPHVIGEHDVHATINLCDRSFDIPVRMTVTADELISGASERFDATFESLAPDIELDGEVAFSRVCTFSTSL